MKKCNDCIHFSPITNYSGHCIIRSYTTRQSEACIKHKKEFNKEELSKKDWIREGVWCEHTEC